MIAKELDPLNDLALTPIEAAGRLAEEQMAFYLKQRFHDDPTVHVINDLRLDINGIVTQVDHLVLSAQGFIAIESKSVTTEVAINERGEWSRVFEGEWKGMASPVVQVEEQLRRIQRLLTENVAELLQKIIGLQKQFGGMGRESFVAISNNGRVTRPAAKDYPQVLKADQASRAVADTLKSWRSRSGILYRMASADDGVVSMSEAELKAVLAFLLARHVPRAAPHTVLEAAHPVDSPILVLPTDTDTEASAKQAQAAEKEKAPRYFCATCKRPVSEAVAKFCWGNRHRFSGKVFCMSHQKSH